MKNNEYPPITSGTIGNDIQMYERDIDTFTFTYIPSLHRLFISGLDEYSFHYDIATTIDIILALFDFNREHTFDELDYRFPGNRKYKEKIKTFKKLSYPIEMVSEEGIIALFELVSESSAYYFLKKHTNFDYHRDFYTQVSGYYYDTLEELNDFTQYARGIDPYYYNNPAELIRPESRWLSIYAEKEPNTQNNIKPKTNRASENPNYSKWREDVLTRDKVCQCCGHDDKLEVHHLFGYKENPSLQTKTGNGVTLCKFCHNKYHSIYGLKDINPIDFMDFIKRYGVRK